MEAPATAQAVEETVAVTVEAGTRATGGGAAAMEVVVAVGDAGDTAGVVAAGGDATEAEVYSIGACRDPKALIVDAIADASEIASSL